MTSETTTSGTVKLPIFSGERDDYQRWEFQIGAYATLGKFAEAMGTSPEADLPTSDAEVLDLTTDEGKRKDKARERNRRAVASLSIALAQDPVALSYVYGGTTAEYPNGLAWKVMKSMEDKFAPDNRTGKTDMTGELMKVTMKAGEDPATLFRKYRQIQNKYRTLNVQVEDEEMISILTKAVSMDYVMVINHEYAIADLKNEKPTMAGVEKAIDKLYRVAKDNKSRVTDESEEIGLGAVQKKFTGTCFNCGKQGHRANECRSSAQGNNGKGSNNSNSNNNNNNDNSNNKKFKGKCHNCGKIGHKKQDCWFREENKDKKQQNKKYGERGNAAVDGETERMELMLCSFIDEDGGDDKEESCGGEFMLSSLLIEEACEDVIDSDSEEESCVDEVDADDETFLKSSESVEVEDTQAQVELCAMARGTKKKIQGGEVGFRNPDIWIADTGASCHLTADDAGAVNRKCVSSKVTMGNASVVSVKSEFDLKIQICNKYGDQLEKALLRNVQHAPGSAYNLLSVPYLVQNDGWSFKGDSEGFMMTKGDQKLEFDIRVPTKLSFVYAICLKRVQEIGVPALAEGHKLTVTKAHELLGHCSMSAAKKASELMGWNLTGSSKEVCVACSLGKAKQKNLPKKSCSDLVKKSGVFGRVYLDISTIRNKTGMPLIKKNNWRIIVDELTGLKFSDFFATKDGMVEPTCVKINLWKEKGLPVNTVRLDNAGENKLLQQRASSADWKLGLEFEFTARDTPQQNSIAEVAFRTIANKGRALMTAANLPEELRFRLFAEAFQAATLLDGLMVVTVDGATKTRYEHVFGKNPEFARYLRVWGEAGTVKTKTATTPKLSDRGIQCMFVGYALDHPGDCYIMYNPDSKRKLVSRDVIWLQRQYFSKEDKAEIGVNIPAVALDVHHEAGEDVPVGAHDGNAEDEGSDDANGNDSDDSDEGSDDDSDSDDDMPSLHDGQYDSDSDSDSDDEVPEPTRTRTGRVIKPPARYNDELGNVAVTLQNRLMQKLKDEPAAAADENEVACVGAGIGGGFINTAELKPMKYKEAMSKPDADKWKAAVLEEKRKIDDYQVFKEVPRSSIPDDAKVLTSTWAMKKKANGVYRARLNARGYEQVDGEHYDEDDKFAPVVNDITINIVLTLALMAGWAIKLLDVLGAFLQGSFEKGRQIYMEVPEGFKDFYGKDSVLLMLRTLYGTIQAAKRFWLKLWGTFANMNYCKSNADPCLYFKWTVAGLVLWISWVDDCMTCGPDREVDRERKRMMEKFDCDDIGEIKEFIGCKISRKKKKRSMRITQPVLLQSFNDEFAAGKKGGAVGSPGAPGETLHKCDEGAEVDAQRQREYRSGVGKLLYMKKSRPEILNAVRDLSRFLGRAGEAHMKAMHRVMRYCLSTPNRGLELKPRRSWDGNREFEFEIEGWSDSDYANDVENRRSVSGWAVFLEGAPIAMKSQMQHSVTLSSTEAEYVAATSCVQDMLFAMQVVESIGLKVKKPMVLHMDNKGAIDLVNTWRVGGRTKHIDVRHHFIRDLKELGVIEIVWKASGEMVGDLFTKNLGQSLFNTHTSVFSGVDEYLDML